jgi:hypothetical protein
MFDELNDGALTASVETVCVAISAIVRDEANQVRRALDDNLVKRYETAMRNDEAFPPVTVARVNDSLVLVDGWHRLAAMERLGVSDTNVVIVRDCQPREIKWLAAEANLRHGKALTFREIRNAFRAYVQARKHRTTGNGFRSYRDIAKALAGARSHNSVRHWMEQDFPRTFRAMGSHPDGGGGAWENEPDPEEDARRLAAQACSRLEEALAAFRAVTSQEDRKEIVKVAREMMGAMEKGGGAWTEVPNSLDNPAALPQPYSDLL